MYERIKKHKETPFQFIDSDRKTYTHFHFIFIFLISLNCIRHITYTYKSIQYKNKPYSDNNEHHSSVAPTDAQHELKWVNNYNETLKYYILHYIQ